MAETRAISRALRWATNNADTSEEEVTEEKTSPSDSTEKPTDSKETPKDTTDGDFKPASEVKPKKATKGSLVDSLYSGSSEGMDG